jgi:hypothetical protein
MVVDFHVRERDWLDGVMWLVVLSERKNRKAKADKYRNGLFHQLLVFVERPKVTAWLVNQTPRHDKIPKSVGKAKTQAAELPDSSFPFME